MYNPLTKHAQQGFIYMKVTFSFAVKKSIKNVKNIQYFLNPVIPNGLVVSLTSWHCLHEHNEEQNSGALFMVDNP